MIGPTTDSSRQILLGNTPVSIRPYFFAANLIALEMKGGGVRPIAVGGTLRRLIAKVAAIKVSEEIGALLAPVQLGYVVKGGSEAAIHAFDQYIRRLGSNCVLKLDFKNAFNCIRRDKVSEAVQSFVPIVYPFIHSAYSSPSMLFWEDKTIDSAEGVQQGDLLGPLLFCLTLHQLCGHLKSELPYFTLMTAPLEAR